MGGWKIRRNPFLLKKVHPNQFLTSAGFDHPGMESFLLLFIEFRNWWAPCSFFSLRRIIFLAGTKGRIPLNKSIFIQKRSGYIGNFCAFIPECLKTIFFFRNLGNWGMDVFFLFLFFTTNPLSRFPPSPPKKKNPDGMHPLKLLCRDCKEFGAVF